MTLVFKCTNCGQALRAQPASAGKLCKCTKCSTLVRIPTAENRPAVQAKPVAPAPRPPRPPRNPLLEELSSLANESKRPSYPMSPAQSFDASPSAAFGEMPPRPKKRKRRKKSGGGAASVVQILLTVFSVIGLLCCGGIGVTAFLLGPKTIVLEAGGYQAVAKGNRTQQRNEANGETQGTMHPITGSEFWIGAVQMPFGITASIEDLRGHFDGFSRSTKIVERGSMRGIHCEGVNTAQLGVLGGITAELEVFLANGKLLYTAYIPGSSKAEALGKSVRNLGSREATWDNTDAFFSSIRPSN